MLLTADAARRIAAATRKVEGVGVDVPPDEWYPYVPDEVDGLKLCRTTAAWDMFSSADLDEYSGEPGKEIRVAHSKPVKAYNRLCNVPSLQYVIVANINGHWYLISTQAKPIDVVTSVFLNSSGLNIVKQTILTLGTKTPAPADTVIASQDCP